MLAVMKVSASVVNLVAMMAFSMVHLSVSSMVGCLELH